MRRFQLSRRACLRGVGATLELDEDPLMLFGEVGGQVIVAVAPDQIEPDPTGSGVEVKRIGSVGGNTLFGLELDELERAYERGDA